MVQSINLFQDGKGLFGGFNGFLDRSFGNENQNNRPLSGLLNRNTLGFQSNPLQLPNSNPLLQQIQQKNANEKADEKKKDEVTLSNFVKDAAEEAVDNARQTPGTTSQVFVSEDGRFEVSIDLQVRRDGSFDLDLAVGFAQSQGAAISSQTNGGGQQTIEEQSTVEEAEAAATGESPQEGAVTEPNAFPPAQFSGFSGIAERFTSFEQSLSTRDLEVNIFFEEAKSVEFQARQQFGDETGDRFQAVAGQISNEFQLNINISGSDINNFNEAANDLLQFDDDGTLGAFLGAASNVLSSDSSNIGSFIDATRSLVGASRDLVSNKLNNFFTDLNSQFGGSLEEIGFEPNFIQSLGENVQNDLDSFFSVTNDLLANLSGSNQIEDPENIEDTELNILEENLEQLQEAREEQIEAGISRPPIFDPEKDELVNDPRKTFEELLAELNEPEIPAEQIQQQQPVDGNFESIA